MNDIFVIALQWFAISTIAATFVALLVIKALWFKMTWIFINAVGLHLFGV